MHTWCLFDLPPQRNSGHLVTYGIRVGDSPRFITCMVLFVFGLRVGFWKELYSSCAWLCMLHTHTHTHTHTHQSVIKCTLWQSTHFMSYAQVLLMQTGLFSRVFWDGPRMSAGWGRGLGSVPPSWAHGGCLHSVTHIYTVFYTHTHRAG